LILRRKCYETDLHEEKTLVVSLVLFNKNCKICGDETNNPDGICDDCKVSMMSEDDITPTL